MARKTKLAVQKCKKRSVSSQEIKFRGGATFKIKQNKIHEIKRRSSKRNEMIQKYYYGNDTLFPFDPNNFISNGILTFRHNNQ